jgi:hypothetical protein
MGCRKTQLWDRALEPEDIFDLPSLSPMKLSKSCLYFIRFDVAQLPLTLIHFPIIIAVIIIVVANLVF